MTVLDRETRRERYDYKAKTAKFLPMSMGCVNFDCDGNLAYLIRSAACFGIQDLHVIGSVPHRSKLNSLSGSTYDYVNIIQHSSPYSFLKWARENKVKIVSAELTDESQKLRDYSFDFSEHICIFTGHETTGVPIEIIKNSDCVEIDMPGIGFCLNTAQAANILLYESCKQYYHTTK